MATKKATKKATTKAATKKPTTKKEASEPVSKRLPIPEDISPDKVRELLDKRGGALSIRTLLAILAPHTPERDELVRAVEGENPDAQTLTDVLVHAHLSNALIGEPDAWELFHEGARQLGTLRSLEKLYVDTVKKPTPSPETAEDITIATLGQKLKANLRTDKAELLGKKLTEDPVKFWNWLASLIPSPVPEATRPMYLSDGDALNLAPIILKRLTDAALVNIAPGNPQRVTFGAKWMIIHIATRTVEFYNVHKNLPGHVACSLDKSDEWLTVRGELTVESIEARLAGWTRPE